MKFNSRDQQILKNYAGINQNILFRTGNTIRTISQSKAVFSIATISDEIKDEFAIYDLSQFLGLLSFIDGADLEVKQNKIVISNGKERTEYATCNPELILAAPNKTMKLPSVDVDFALEEAALTKAIKALGLLKLPEIAIIGDGENVYISAVNSKDTSASTYRQQVGTTDKEFKLFFLAENLNLIPGKYDVEVSKKGFAQFAGDDITYWIAVESNSSFPG